MSLTLITGRAITGKTGVLHRALIQAVSDGSGAVLLLPSFADVRRARAELSSRVPVGLRIDTLDGWAEALWALHGTGEGLLTGVTRSALMRAALRSLSNANPLASTRGYHELAQAIAERTAGLRLPEVERRTDGQLLEAVEAYRALCREHGLLEPGEALRRLAECGPLAGMTVGVNRFTDLSPAQETFLTGISGQNDVYIALNWDQNSVATRASTPLVERLIEAGADHRHLEAPAAHGELEHLEARLYDPREPLGATGAVQLMTAAGDEAECALVAGAVREFVTGGVPPHEIAVTFRDLARRENLLRAALEAEGLRCEIDLAVPLPSTALGRSVSALVSVVRAAAGWEALTTFLLSPYSGASIEDVEELDARVRGFRIEETGRLLDFASELSTGSRNAIRSARSVCRANMDAAGARAWESLVTALVTNAFGRPDRPVSEQVIDGSVHGMIVTAAGELASRGLAEPAADLLFHLAAAKAHSGGEERDGFVYITEAHRMRSRRFTTVVVGGLTAEEFSSEKREPLAVQLLQRLGLPAGTEERLSERLLFYSLVTRAREALVLVRQSSSAVGNEHRPSAFWDEIRDLYRSATDSESGVGEGLSVTRTLPLSELEQAAPCFAPDRRALRRRLAAGELRASEPIRGAIRTRPWTDTGYEFSVTEIEAYHACPYRWFYDRVIRPRQIDAVFEAKERGSLVHQVMAEFYRRMPGNVGHRVTAGNLPRSLSLLEIVWQEVAEKSESTTRGLAERLALLQAREWVREVVVSDATLLEGFVPSCHEWAFGSRVDRPFNWGSVSLKGSVDRLDENRDLLVVTDYKSSSSVPGATSLQKEGMLQALVYAEAAGRLLSRRVVGGFYRSMPSGEMRGFWNGDLAEPESWVAGSDIVTDEEHSALRAWAETTIEEAAAGIRAADIAPRPRFKNACTWCGAQAFCEEANR